MERVSDMASDILECPHCEDADCKLNICGLCHSTITIIECVPGDMYTCSSAYIDFVRSDYNFFD